MTYFQYAGVNEHGHRQEAAMRGDSAAAVAKHLFDRGWQPGTQITLGGRLVGEITVDLHGDRTWWGEKPKPPARVRRRSSAFTQPKGGRR